MVRKLGVTCCANRISATRSQMPFLNGSWWIIGNKSGEVLPTYLN